MEIYHSTNIEYNKTPQKKKSINYPEPNKTELCTNSLRAFIGKMQKIITFKDDLRHAFVFDDKLRALVETSGICIIANVGGACALVVGNGNGVVVRILD